MKKLFRMHHLWLFVLLAVSKSLPGQPTGVPILVNPGTHGGSVQTLINAPQRLSMGSFDIAIERYESTGQYNPSTRVYSGATGTGWVKLPCQQLPDNTSNGIRIRFVNLVIQRFPGNIQSGNVIAGMAQFPVAGDPQKFYLALDSFSLEVSSWTLTPQNAGKAKARLLLPASLASGTGFGRVSLDLGEITLTGRCEFYQSMPGSPFGPVTVGNTPLSLNGSGFIADFSAASGTAPGGSAPAWKGVILFNGESAGQPSGTVYANTGYLSAPYRFINATIQNDGFYGDLATTQPYRFFPVLPANYSINANSISIRVEKNKPARGTLNQVEITLPVRSVRAADGSEIKLTASSLSVNKDLDLLGSINQDQLSDKVFCWGEFNKPESNCVAFGVRASKAYLFFPGAVRDNFYPLSGNSFAEPPGLSSTNWTNDQVKNSGLTGVILRSCKEFFLQSPDVPNPAPAFPLGERSLSFFVPSTGWVSVQSSGVHASLSLHQDIRDTFYLGNPAAGGYAGKEPFHFGTEPDLVPVLKLNAQWVESCVFKSAIEGAVTLDQPLDVKLKVRELAFTSTAHFASGKIDLSSPVNIKGWGLKLEGKPTAGVLSIKTGQVILGAAGIREKQHFAQPFFLTWGELLANGSIGRLFFDFHTPGQQFDGLDFSPQAIALSDEGIGRRYLRVAGAVSFPFFGANYIDVKDFFVPNPSFGDRRVELNESTPEAGFRPSNRHIEGVWGEDIAQLAFDINYNEAEQNGFIGKGPVELQTFADKHLPSNIEIKGSGLCITISATESDGNYPLQFGPVDSVAYLAGISGKLCVDMATKTFEKLELTATLQASTDTRMGSIGTGSATAKAMLLITRARTRFDFNGMAALNMGDNLELYASGKFWLLYEIGSKAVDGAVDGRFSAVKDDILFGVISAVASAEGHANWHIGTDYQSLQGNIKAGIMAGPSSNVGAFAGFNGGLYMGVNAPKSEAWVIQGLDKFQHLNMEFMPEHLTGMYFFGQIKTGIDLWVISGGYELSAGLGIFRFKEGTQVPGFLTPATGVLNFPAGVQVWGLIGGSIYGDILGGVVSARTGFNLQISLPERFLFAGTAFLEGCLLFVCHDVTLSMGYDSGHKGFFIQ